MKTSVILTSWNRPKFLRDALKSVADQTHPDVQLIVLDESDLFDIHDVLAEFRFRDLVVRRFSVDEEERRTKNRLAINLNLGLDLARGDLVSFLCDDDYYFPDWLSEAVRFFEARPDVHAAYGKICLSITADMDFPKGLVHFPGVVVTDPHCKLDHNQVIHRRFDPPFRWREDASFESMTMPDAFYFREIAAKHPFHPIDAFAAVKRFHKRNYRDLAVGHLSGADGLAGSREDLTGIPPKPLPEWKPWKIGR